MTYFFDNCMSASLVEILKILGVDACHLRDHFPQDTADEVWIPEIGAKRWTIISGDFRIYKNAAQRAILVQANVKTVWMPQGFVNKTAWDQAAWIVKAWPTIHAQVERENRHLLLRVTDNGKLEPMPLK